MEYPDVEKLLDKSEGSIYKLVILAAKRVKELNAGAQKLVEANPNVKLAVIALREIEKGAVRLKAGK